MQSMLCFTPPFLCANPELSENCEKEVPKNVVDPLYASVPLSLLEPPSASVSYSVVESLSRPASWTLSLQLTSAADPAVGLVLGLNLLAPS